MTSPKVSMMLLFTSLVRKRLRTTRFRRTVSDRRTRVYSTYHHSVLEPSTVLASRILRASDNPSPPPQNPAHPRDNYVPEKDGHFLSHGVSVPPSPFRPINLLERLNQLSVLPFDSSRTLSTPASGDRPNTSESSIRPPRGFVSPESCSQFVASVSMKGALREDLGFTDTRPSSSNHYTVDDFPPRSSQRACEPANFADNAKMNPSSQPTAGLHEQLMTMTGSLDSEAFSSSPTQAVDSSSNLVKPLALHVCLGEPLPGSRRQSCPKSSPLVPNATALSSSPSDEGKASVATEMTVTGVQDNNGDKSSSMNDGSPSVAEELQENKCTKGGDANLHRGLDSPHSADVLSESIEEAILSAEPSCIKHPPATPPQTPRSSAMHPDFSWSAVQRPIVAPTPIRANSGARKLFSPAKFSSEVDDICRTPAQRVPIETALARGTSSFQKSIQLSTGSDHSQIGRFPTLRALVFTRPALDDPSRSPAKRIPVMDSTASPARRDRTYGSPTRLGHRARSASVEPPSMGLTIARSRSVEPGPTITNPDSHERLKESVFPMVPVPPRSNTKLPFPLVPNQKSSSDLPPPIPEEDETAEIGHTGTDTALGRVTQDTMSRLRQPSANSRIPRIGNKPYIRPSSKDGQATVGTMTVRMTRAPVSSLLIFLDLSQIFCLQKASPFQFTHKNDTVWDSKIEVSSTQLADDLRSVGSLKRKRGVEAAVPSSSQPVMIRQVVPGILSGKHALKLAKIPPQVQTPSELSPPKVTQPLKFRKVVDGMLSARYAPGKVNPARTGRSDSTLPPPSPLSELSSSSNEEPSVGKLVPAAHSPARADGETSDPSCVGGEPAVAEPSTSNHSSTPQNTGGGEPPSRPRRTFRTRKPAQQQYVLDVFNCSTSTRPPPARRRPQSRTEGDGFMGMSTTALKALTTSNTTKNQQTVSVLATEVIRKEGLRPESPTVKARTILQKRRDERDMRRRGRAQRRAQRSDEGLGTSDTEVPGDRTSLGGHADYDDENDYAVPQKHCRGPGDEEDYVTPERPERFIESLRLEEADRKIKPVKQVKWHRGLSTAVYLEEIDPKPRPLPKNVIVRGCLAPTSKVQSRCHAKLSEY